MQSTSPSGLTTLEQWKQQIRDSINLLRHGVSGYNRTIQSINSTLLTKEDMEVLAKENPIDFSIHEVSCPLRERSIQQINLGNLVATVRLPEKIGNFDLSPDLPIDFSSIEQNRIEGTDSKAIDRMSETLTGIASSQQKMLQLMELQMKKAGILIDKPRGTCQEGEFRLPGQPELSKFLFEKVIDIFKRP
ncbi:hypothetical protein, partial [Endozoicomonas sp. ONNA2]|uniref:hypothetical protein n=1 Tax=Endozoicomonas sp. ONNA2 TaxID=2828741 RepID=UPI002147F8A3